LLSLVVILAGCVDPPGWSAPTVLETSLDGAGALDATGTLRLRLSGPVERASAADNVVLVRGEPEPLLMKELAHPPLPARTRARLVAMQVAVEDATVLLTPRRPLVENTRYSLLIGPALRVGEGRLGRLSVRAFSTGAAGAPVLSLVEPADGATGVIRNLRQVRARFSREVTPAEVSLVGDDDVGIDVAVEPDGCPGCVRLILTAPLDGGRHYTLRAAADAVDAEGRAPFGDPPGFDTGDQLRDGPVLAAPPELRASDGCVVARFQAGVPTRASLCVADRCADDEPRVAHELALSASGLGPPYRARLTVADESTRPPSTLESPLDLSPVPLEITEVLSDPLGPRTQQFVEVANRGNLPQPLDGLTLRTAAGVELLPSLSLAPGAFAILVGQSYVLDDGVDRAPPSGTPIVRAAGPRLVGHGLRAAGEPIWIEDGAGRIVTRSGGYPQTLARGQSVVRRTPRACDVPSSFGPNPSGGATPGAP
jgi:hypothetical protein